MFNNSFSSTGRIGRLEYGLSLVLYFTGVTILGQLMRGNGSELWGFSYIPLIWFLTAQGAKRCHDLDNSGWYQIIPFYFFWMVLQKGSEGLNGYGNRTENSQPLAQKPVAHGFSMDNTVYHNPQPRYMAPANKPQKIQRQRPPLNQQTVLEVANVNYALTQDVLKKLRLLDKTNSLNYSISENIAVITISHRDTTQNFLDDFYRIMPNIEVREVKTGSIIIKIK